jgi:hypothetical protein
MKQNISLLELKTTVGFIYWVNETHDLRGLKNTKIEEYVVKLKELQKEYNLKYPNGLTGWKE